MRWKTAFWMLNLIFLLAGCGGQTSQPTPTAIAPGSQVQATDKVQVLLVNSQVVVGRNRFAVALIDDQNQMIDDAAVRFRYFVLTDPQTPVFEQDAVAEKLQSADGFTTIYANYRDFAAAGNWGVEVQIVLADGTAALQRIAFEVLADAPSIAPGDKVPLVDTPTLESVEGDLTILTSAVEPNPAFYEMSLPEALENGRFTFLYFSTPAFCQTQLCGPGYEVFNELYEAHQDEYNFIHVEVYDGLPNPAETEWQVSPVMGAFGLTTEPWLYLIDPEGQVVYRVEGLFTAAEVEEQVAAFNGS